MEWIGIMVGLQVIHFSGGGDKHTFADDMATESKKFLAQEWKHAIITDNLIHFTISPR